MHQHVARWPREDDREKGDMLMVFNRSILNLMPHRVKSGVALPARHLLRASQHYS